MEITSQGNELKTALSTQENLPEDGQKILSVLQNADQGSSPDDLASVMEDKDDSLDSQQWEEVIEGLKDRNLLADSVGSSSLENTMGSMDPIGGSDTLQGHSDDVGHLMLRPRNMQNASKDCTRCGSHFTGQRALSDIDLCVACASQDAESTWGAMDDTISNMGLTIEPGEFSI